MAGNAGNWYKPQRGKYKGKSVYVPSSWRGSKSRAEVLRNIELDEQGGVTLTPKGAAQRGGAYDRNAGVPTVGTPEIKHSATKWLVQRAEPQSINRRRYEEVGRSARGRVLTEQVDDYYNVPGTGYFAGRVPDTMVRQLLEHAQKITGDRFAQSWEEGGFRFTVTHGQYRSTFGNITFTYEPADGGATFDQLDAAINAGKIKPTRTVR